MEVTLDNINTTDEYKIKVIEDPSLQCQIIHCGTIKDLFQVPANVQSGTGRKYRTGVIRATAIEYGRNDYLKLYDMAKAMAEYYFLEKNSATIETSLMKTSASLPLGAVVGNIKDKDKWVPTNTAVSSVEYNIDVNRKTISTSKPVIPLFKNLERKSQGIKANTAVDIAPAPKIVEKKLPEPSGVIAGGGTSTPVTYDAFKIQGINNTLYPSPLHGIIWSANMPANNRVTTDYTNLAIAEGLNTDTGFGIGQSIFTGERKLIANLGLVSISGSGVPWTTSLMNGNVVTLGSATVDVSGFHGSPPAVVLYKAYIPTDRY